MQQRESAGPLAGMKVLEVSQVLTAAYATMVLGDLGADIIKVERPDVGDTSRTYGPPAVGDTSYYYWSVNRNKRSVVLDLKDPSDNERLHQLIGDSDALIHNLLPSAAQKLHLGYEEARASNDQLIYCAISGFGVGHAHESKSALDIVVQAAAGLMSITGEPDGVPLRSPAPVGDITAGLYAALAVVAAYHERQKSGKGRSIEVSMLQSAASLLPYHWGEWFVSEQVPQRRGNEHPTMVPYGCYPTRDGYVALAVNSDAAWRNFCLALGLPTAQDDPRFLHNSDRIANRDLVLEIVEGAFLTRTSDELVDQFERYGIPCSKVRNFDDVQGDPAVDFLTLPDQDGRPGAGATVVASPIRMSDAAQRPAGPAPRLGQHSRDVLGATHADEA